jgi:hypothetical protein
MGLVEALQEYLSGMTPRKALSDAAVALSPIPVVGDILGGADDAAMYYSDPESRTLGNYGMSALGLLPFIPSAGVTRRIGEMDFDPRFDPRKKEQERLKSLTTEVDEKAGKIPTKSIYDLEGKPFITTMSDRTDARGVLEGINNVELPSKVKLHGGQDYMFDNAGEVWASGKSPVNSILKRATQLKKQTGEDPFLLPWRMAPSGSDFAHMTGEAMLSYASAGMGKSAKKDLNKSMKGFIPDWKGVDNPDSITQFKSTSDKKRKAIKNMLDKQFRNEGGLSLGEARLAISDPSQLNAPQGGLMNIGQIDASRGRIERPGINTYPYAIGGTGIGRLKEDVMVHQLLPEVAKFRGITDVMNPSQADLRSMQMKPFGGVLTEGLLRAIEKANKK